MPLTLQGRKSAGFSRGNHFRGNVCKPGIKLFDSTGKELTKTTDRCGKRRSVRGGSVDGRRAIGYGCTMTTAAPDATAYDDDEPLGPSLAIPPLYVVRSACRCPECGQAQHVYMLGCAAFHDAEDRHPIEEFHFLRRVGSVPPPLLALLKAKLPRFYADRTEDDETPYLMNHCPCEAKLDDYFVCGDVGAAFWPDTPKGYASLKLLELPAEEQIPIECSCMVGGGEYLKFANTWTW